MGRAAKAGSPEVRTSDKHVHSGATAVANLRNGGDGGNGGLARVGLSSKA